MKTFRPKLLIRADAGPTIGTGHVMRCVALADAWRQRGGDVHLISGELPLSLCEQLRDREVILHESGSETGSDADATHVIDIANDMSANCIVLDGYRFDRDYQSRIRHQGFTLLFFSDAEDGEFVDADFVLNQNAFAHKSDYVSSMATVMAGPEYALLRREFVEFRKKVEPEFKARIQNILVCFGGGDEPNLTCLALESIQRATTILGADDLSVNVVLGHCNQHYDKVVERCHLPEADCRIHQSVDRMAELIAQTDLAITSGGSICYELAALGVPALIIPIADNQRPVVKTMDHLGVAEGIAELDSLSVETLAGRISDLVRNIARREQMSIRGPILIDCKGADRVAGEIIKSLIRLRPATFDDAERLRDWRNDLAVREASFSTQNVCFDTHVQWLVSRLISENCRLMIAFFETDMPFGQVRFDLDDSGNATISVSIDERYRGRGLASSLIARSTEKFVSEFAGLQRIQTVIANIKTSNFASCRSFEAAGYVFDTNFALGGSDAVRYVFEVGETVHAIDASKQAG